VLAELDALRDLGWRGIGVLRRRQLHRQQARGQTDCSPRWRAGKRENGYPFSFYTEASVNLAADRGAPPA
jgi:hypothetical protein